MAAKIAPSLFATGPDNSLVAADVYSPSDIMDLSGLSDLLSKLGAVGNGLDLSTLTGGDINNVDVGTLLAANVPNPVLRKLIAKGLPNTFSIRQLLSRIVGYRLESVNQAIYGLNNFGLTFPQYGMTLDQYHIYLSAAMDMIQWQGLSTPNGPYVEWGINQAAVIYGAYLSGVLTSPSAAVDYVNSYLATGAVPIVATGASTASAVARPNITPSAADLLIQAIQQLAADAGYPETAAALGVLLTNPPTPAAVYLTIKKMLQGYRYPADGTSEENATTFLDSLLAVDPNWNRWVRNGEWVSDLTMYQYANGDSKYALSHEPRTRAEAMVVYYDSVSPKDPGALASKIYPGLRI